IHATDVRLERLKELNRQYGIQISSDNAELIRHADIVILAVKPQIMDAVLTEIAPAVTRRKLLISIAAGVSTAKIRAVLRKDARRRRGPDGARPDHRDDPRDPDRSGRRGAAARDRAPPGRGQGHGLLPGGHLDRRHRRARGGRDPHDVHQGGRAGDPALARARAGAEVMFVINYFFVALANLVNLLIVAYIWIIIARAILSWVSPDPYNPVVRFLHRVTEPA